MARSQMLVAVCLLWIAAAWAGPAHAGDGCPRLADGSPLHWQQRELPDFVVCRAVDGDGREVMSVTIGASSPFRPRGAQRVASGRIDGQRVRWYRGEDGWDPDALLRETLLHLDRGRVAHISLRADDQAQLDAAIAHAQGLRFGD